MSVIINKEEYEIIKELPRGGFGRVYKLKKNGKFYAYKKILIIDATQDTTEGSLGESVQKAAKDDAALKTYLEGKYDTATSQEERDKINNLYKMFFVTNIA